MDEAMQTLFADDVVDELLTEAWRTFLDTDLIRVDANDLAAEALYASIAIIGDRASTMVIACDAELALRCASHVLQMEPADLSPDDVSDLLGELANIVAGNLKGVYGSATEHLTLSLPVVSAGEQMIHGSELRLRAAYESDGSAVVCEMHDPL